MYPQSNSSRPPRTSPGGAGASQPIRSKLGLLCVPRFRRAPPEPTRQSCPSGPFVVSPPPLRAAGSTWPLSDGTFLSAAAPHYGLGDRGGRRRWNLFFDWLRGLAVENLADELLARFGVFWRAGLGFDGRPLFRSDLLDC